MVFRGARIQHGEEAAAVLGLGAVEGVRPTMAWAWVLAWAGVVRPAGVREVQEVHEAERI
jgi:hypothetical protein